MRKRVSCVYCDHIDVYGGGSAHVTVCHAYTRPDFVPYQGERRPLRIEGAWRRCRGTKFTPHRPWWKRLLGIV